MGWLGLVRYERMQGTHPEPQTVSMVLVQLATAKAVLVTAQTRANLTLVIITWCNPAVETHTSCL